MKYYDFYQCATDCHETQCQKLSMNMTYLPGRDYESKWSRLIPVPRWMPMFLRRQYLYFSSLPRRLKIDDTEARS